MDTIESVLMRAHALRQRSLSGFADERPSKLPMLGAYGSMPATRENVDRLLRQRPDIREHFTKPGQQTRHQRLTSGY